MEEDHHYTPGQEDNYHHDDQPQVDIQVEQYQYQQVVLIETADSSDNSANNDQNQQQQPPQYQPQPPQQQQPPQYQPPRQPPPPYQPPVQFPPQQPTQAPPRPIQYLAPQPPRPVPFPLQSPQHQNYANQPPPQQYPPQQPPYQPPQQFPPQNLQNNYANAAPNPQNHPFGKPPSPAKFPPQSQSPAQYPPPAGSSSHPPQGFNDIPQPSKKHQAPPPVQVGYNKPNYQPPQQQQQQQQQPQQQYYSTAPAPAQGVPMQGPYGPQGTPINANMMNPIGTEAWRTGLFDCMDDPNNALITAFVPCLTFGQIAEVVDNGTTSCGTSALLYGLVGAFIGVPFIMSCTYRTKIRSKYGLVETPAPDWVTHLFCEPCALCQEYRELNMRGLDPSIGWQGNIAKAMQQQQPNMMTPPTNHMMSMGRPGIDLMGRPEADHDHQELNSNQAFHQTLGEQQSPQPEQQISPPNPTHSQTYVLGRPCRAENDEHRLQEQEQAQAEEHIAPRNSTSNSHIMQENQTHQQWPQPPHHHHVHYYSSYWPPPNPHHSTNLMALHNAPNHYASQGHLQAMPAGLRPHPTSHYPPPFLYHSQPINNYSGPQHVQQVVVYPPPASYNYPSSSRNPQPYVHHNNFATTGIPMMQNVQYIPLLMPDQFGSAEGTTWKTGLFDCLLDPPSAIITMIFPCWTFGQIAEIVDNGQTSSGCNALIYMMIWCFILVPCCLSCTYRRKLRNKLNLPESPGPDCIIHFLCESCALCQEHRELELRGLDPSLGWVGNMEQLQRLQQKRQSTTVVPPMTQRMMGY